MEKKKNILTGSLIASAIVACSSFTTSATEAFSHSNLGSSAEVRTNLSERAGHALELNCGTKSKDDATKDGAKKKDGKCGKKMKKDGKCGKKMKDGKCGEGKCGEGKCGKDKKATSTPQ